MINDLSYLDEICERLDLIVSNLSLYNDNILSSFDSYELNLLRSTYLEIVRRDHTRYLIDIALNKIIDHSITPNQDSIRNLLNIFDMLDDKNIDPFGNKLVSLKKHEEVRDWSSLPDELKFLIKPATEFALCWRDEEHDRFISKISTKDYYLLRRTGNTIRNGKYILDIYNWLDSVFIHSPEAFAVKNLLILLESMNIDFSPNYTHDDKDLVESLWTNINPNYFSIISDATMSIFSKDCAFSLFTKGLSRISTNRLGNDAFHLLYPFRSDSTLKWIENNIADIVSDDWGNLAALSNFTWSYACKWLGTGRPLSLVALDALVSFCTTLSDHPVIQELKPKLNDPADISVMDETVSRYLMIDQTPRVTRRCSIIQSNWDEIVNIV